MPVEREITAFTLNSEAFLSVVMYGLKPIPSDYRWGKYRKVVFSGITYHFFMRGGGLSDEAIQDVIDAHLNGRSRRIEDTLDQ